MKFIKRAAILGAASIVATTGLAVAPAVAASGPVVYVCTTPVGAKEFTATVDTDLPTAMVVGQSAAPTVNASVTIPADLSELAYGFLGARFADGSASLGNAINGVAQTPVAATIPQTPVPATGALVLPATGTATAFAPSAVGTYTLVASDFTAAISFLKINDAGTPGDTSDDTLQEALKVDTTCTLKTKNADDSPFTQDTTIDTVSVTKAPTTTKVKAKYAKKKITSKIAVLGGAPATGKAKVVVKLGKKTIKKATVAVNAGKAKLVVKKITKKGKYTVKVAYKGDAGHLASKGKATVRVK